jgi:hypothetical protein
LGQTARAVQVSAQYILTMCTLNSRPLADCGLQERR